MTGGALVNRRGYFGKQSPVAGLLPQQQEFDRAQFRKASSAEFPASLTLPGASMTLSRGAGQAALFGSGGRGKVAEFSPGDIAYVRRGFGPAIRNIGDGDLEMIQVRDRGAFEQTQLDRMIWSSPTYLLANNLARVSSDVLAALKGG